MPVKFNRTLVTTNTFADFYKAHFIKCLATVEAVWAGHISALRAQKERPRFANAQLRNLDEDLVFWKRKRKSLQNSRSSHVNSSISADSPANRRHSKDLDAIESLRNMKSNLEDANRATARSSLERAAAHLKIHQQVMSETTRRLRREFWTNLFRQQSSNSHTTWWYLRIPSFWFSGFSAADRTFDIAGIFRALRIRMRLKRLNYRFKLGAHLSGHLTE